jgi:hypothetical protein
VTRLLDEQGSLAAKFVLLQLKKNGARLKAGFQSVHQLKVLAKGDCTVRRSHGKCQCRTNKMAAVAAAGVWRFAAAALVQSTSKALAADEIR